MIGCVLTQNLLTERLHFFISLRSKSDYKIELNMIVVEVMKFSSTEIYTLLHILKLIDPLYKN